MLEHRIEVEMVVGARPELALGVLVTAPGVGRGVGEAVRDGVEVSLVLEPGAEIAEELGTLVFKVAERNHYVGHDAHIGRSLRIVDEAYSLMG